MEKTLNNSNIKQAKKQVKDLEVYGNGDLFKLISKASSQSEGWMKSTKAMEIINLGVVLQVTTQQGDNVAEALTFIPAAKIAVDENGNNYIKAISYDCPPGPVNKF